MKKKKKLKGMSLIEIIISLAVIALLSLVLLTVGTTIDSTKKATNKLKHKITQQSPYAASRTARYVDADGEGKWLDAKDISIKVKIEASGSYYDYGEKVKKDVYGNDVKDDEGNLVYEVDTSNVTTHSYSNPEAQIDAHQYNTKDVVIGGPNASKANENLNLKFIDFTPDAVPDETT